MMATTEPQVFDVTLRFVPGYGWLYLIVIDGIEEARGEFKPDAAEALKRGMDQVQRMFGEREAS
jgi:hypothetical protein